MTDYLTLTVNEKILNSLGVFFIWFILILMVVSLIRLIVRMANDEVERKEKERRELISKPYKEKYEQLKKDAFDYYANGKSNKKLREKYGLMEEYHNKNSKYINYRGY